MRSFWPVFALMLAICLPATFVGCSNRVSQDNADQYEESLPEDDDEEGDSGDGEEEDEEEE